MSLPTGRQLLLFAALQLVLLWGIALLLARSVTPVGADTAPAATSAFELDWTTSRGPWSLVSDAGERSALGGSSLAEGSEGALSPGFWQRAAGSREREHRVKRPGRWRASVQWLPGPTGLVPVPIFQKPCRAKRESSQPRS